MGARWFTVSIAVIMAVVLLSIPEETRAMLAIVLGLGVAVYFMAPSWLVMVTLEKFGIQVALDDALSAICVLHAGWVIILAVAARESWAAGRRDHGRLLAAKVALLIALPLVAFTSLETFSQGWPG
jgi:hypothetical protein